MELEFFCKPEEEMKWFSYWKEFCHSWLLSLGMTPENIKLRDHDAEELSHYSNATTDIEYLFPFGWGELWGIADRTNFDLKQHAEHSGVSLDYTDPETNEKFLPYCIEPSLGADRAALAFLCDAYDEEKLENDTRTVLHLSPVLAPFKAAILPLQKQLIDKAQEIYDMLLPNYMVDFDVTGSIGKRYRRQDEIGTPLCITVDFETLEDGKVTIRDRDTMQQERVEIGKVSAFVGEKVKF
jgi:glycyl-tRNA synthetase